MGGNPQNEHNRFELTRLIQRKYADISKVNKQREKVQTTASIGASAVLGAVVGGAALFFTGPIVASGLAVSGAFGIYKGAMAHDRDENRKKISHKNTSNRNR